MQSDTYDWDELARTWRQHNRQVLWRTHSDAVNAALLKRWLPTGRVETLLKTDTFDEAFGSGLYPLLASRAQNVIGIDVSTQVLVATRARHPDFSVYRADVRQLPFDDGTLDEIVSLSTLDHFESFEDIEMSLREVHRTLRIGGELIITLDNLTNPIVALRNGLPFSLLNRLGIVPYYVGRTCGPRRLLQLLTKVGLEVLDSTGIMHCPRVIAVAAAGILDRLNCAGLEARYLKSLMLMEKLQALPSRFLTGHFVAARAVKR